MFSIEAEIHRMAQLALVMVQSSHCFRGGAYPRKWIRAQWPNPRLGEEWMVHHRVLDFWLDEAREEFLLRHRLIFPWPVPIGVPFVTNLPK